MPKPVRFLIWHALVGFGIAALFVAMLIVLDVGRLHTLMRGAPDGGLAEWALLVFFTGLTFASLQMGVAIWQQGER